MLWSECSLASKSPNPEECTANCYLVASNQIQLFDVTSFVWWPTKHYACTRSMAEIWIPGCRRPRLEEKEKALCAFVNGKDVSLP